ncbi:MAG: four-carbon acid sugar kinase family protein, partial [Microcystaceae cyanobacterium]
ILTSLANLGPQPLAAEAMAKYKPTTAPGAVIVGSHVKKTTEQLANLLQEPGAIGVEIDVTRLRDYPDQRELLLTKTLEKIKEIHQGNQTPVIYTSRQELAFDTVQKRLDFGLSVSQLLMDIVKNLPTNIGFLISKGGITSNDVLSTGLSLRSARLLGQVLPGCSVVRTAPDHPLFPNLPVVLFPGNVGDSQGLATVYRRLALDNP